MGGRLRRHQAGADVHGAGLGGDADRGRLIALERGHTERAALARRDAREGAMGKLDGKVAFITGAARGQGRSHAVRLAEEGADIIAVDICQQMEVVGYPMSAPEDLAQTVKEVTATGRRIVARRVDVRDYDTMQQAFDEGVAELG